MEHIISDLEAAILDALQSGAVTFPIPRGTTHQQWSSHLGRVCGLREFYYAAPFRAALEAEGGLASLATRVVYRYLWLQPLPPQMPQMMPQGLPLQVFRPAQAVWADLSDSGSTWGEGYDAHVILRGS